MHIKTSLKSFVLFFLCITVFTLIANDKTEFFMVKNGKPTGIIVYRNGNIRAYEAALELQYAFQKISNAKVPLATEIPNNFKGNIIHIGYPSKAPKGLYSPSYLPPEGYILKTINNTLYMFGDDKLLSAKWNIHRDGTFASVSYLLDKYLGCRFVMSGVEGEYYPQNKNIIIPKLSLLKTPGLPNRGLRGMSKDPEIRKFYRRHRLGRAFVYEGSHNFEHWYKLYGKKYPDIFALQLDGTRIPPYPLRSQQCITNPKYLDLWYNQVISQMNNRPEIVAVSATFNDAGSHFFCRCKNCRALDPKNAKHYRYYYGKNHKDIGYMPAVTDRYMHIVNKSARRLAQDWPGKFVLYTAYRNGSSAPVKEKIEPNVVIYFAGFNYVCDKGRKLGQENFLKWRKLTSNIIIRPNYLHHGAAMPLFYGKKMYEDFQLCMKAGIKGWDFDAIGGHCGSTGFHYYLAARLQSNPEQTYDEIFNEYCNILYGDAAKEMKHYFLELEKFTNKLASTNNNNGIQGGWGANAPTYYTNSEIKRFNKLLDLATIAAKNNTKVKNNIDLCRKSWEYTKLLCAGLIEVRKANNSKAGEKEFAALEKWRAANKNSKAVNVKTDFWRHSCRRTAAKDASYWQKEQDEYVMPLEY